VSAFTSGLSDPCNASAGTAEHPLSLVGAAALWSGWLTDATALDEAPIVIRA
jgi:hypothetical protein